MSNDRKMSAERIANIHFDYALEGIVETDAQLSVLRANPAATSILCRPLKALLKQPLDVLLQPHSSEQLLRHFKLLREQGINQTELEVNLGDERSHIIKLSSIEADENFLLHMLDDVSMERLRSQELLDARNAAEAANRAKDEFLANISHEIRTPLNGIIGLTQLALASELAATQRERLETVLQSSKTLQRMLNDLLDFAKIESGKLEYEQAPFALSPLFDELASIVAHSALDKPIEFVFDIAPSVPSAIVGDRLRLGQVLVNLLSNAVKFTSHGHVMLTVETVEERLLFTVVDTGEGIREETLQRLFQPFAQADASTTRRFGGTGLGLFIAKQLTQGMGGQLVVTSNWGAGSTFRVEVPLIPAGPPISEFFSAQMPLGTVAIESERMLTAKCLEKMVLGLGGTLARGAAALTLTDVHAARPEIPAGPHLLLTDATHYVAVQAQVQARRDTEIAIHPLTPGVLVEAARRLCGGGLIASDTTKPIIPNEFRGHTIAVAEDVPVNQQVIHGLLSSAGIKVVLADNGKDLLARLWTQPVDLILMDVQMPEMDGYEATRQLRSQGWQGPIIGLSAGITAAEMGRCMNAGMSDFLPKPIDFDELWGALTRWLPPRAVNGQNLEEVHSASEDIQHTGVNTKPISSDLQARLARAGIDLSDALPRFLGESTALATAIARFAEQHAADADICRSQWQASDCEALHKTAHGLKGAAATIGAPIIHHLACAIERLSGDSDASLAVPLFDLLHQAIQLLRSSQADSQPVQAQ